MYRIPLAALALVCLAVCPAVGAADADATIRDFLDTYIKHSNARQIDPLAELFRDDTLVVQFGEEKEGSVRSILEDLIADWEKYDASFEIREKPDIERKNGEAVVSFPLRIKASYWIFPVNRTVNKRLTLVRTDDGWRISRDVTEKTEDG
jgi:ketosteroid isomerase-like protein